jgi:hypothetical protein
VGLLRCRDREFRSCRSWWPDCLRDVRSDAPPLRFPQALGSHPVDVERGPRRTRREHLVDDALDVTSGAGLPPGG